MSFNTSSVVCLSWFVEAQREKKKGWKRIRLKPESENTLYIFAMLRMFPELYITTKKVLAEDLGVKPKNITHINPRQDADYSQAVLQAATNWQVQLLADKAITSVIPVPALLKPASNPLKVLKHPSYEPEKLQSSSGPCYFTTFSSDFFFLFRNKHQQDLRPSYLGYSNINCFIFFGHTSKIKTSKNMFFFPQFLFIFMVFSPFPPPLLSAVPLYSFQTQVRHGQSLENAEVNLSAASKTLRDYLTQEDASASRRPWRTELPFPRRTVGGAVSWDRLPLTKHPVLNSVEWSCRYNHFTKGVSETASINLPAWFSVNMKVCFL